MNKILLIDDDKDFNDTLKEFLEYEGFSVICAYNGKEGLSLIRKEKPDLIITDIVMPNVDGLEVLVELQREPLSFPTKIIAISGGGRIDGEYYLDTAEAFNTDYTFEKPLVVGELLKAIRELLN
ncbi:hypothetical protein A9Q99_04690 [Gammaproteobacteria bacterium 45_16_T64]|nr:hypothetical protein A9Q99_04690 [Gammaproteobacteria bacterium 45_16_T64]